MKVSKRNPEQIRIRYFFVEFLYTHKYYNSTVKTNNFINLLFAVHTYVSNTCFRIVLFIKPTKISKV